MPLNIEIEVQDCENLTLEIIDTPFSDSVSIDDSAGIGDTDVTWSANKTVTAIQEAVDAPANPPISWHDQSIENSVTIPPNKNAWSFGPTITIAEGQAVTVSEGSFWTVANGEVQQ